MPFASILSVLLAVGLLTALALAPSDTCRTSSGTTTIIKGDRL